MARKLKRAAKAKTPRRNATKPDPIFAAIAEYKKLVTAWNRMYDVVDRAEHKASKAHGMRPWSLVAWRNYSAIGGSEIDDARERFLREHVAPRETIEKEYLAAKDRERAGQRAERAWDRRAGIMPLRRQLARANAVERRAAMRMATMRPTTAAGAAAMLAYVVDDAKDGEIEWHGVSFNTLIATLAAWGKVVRQ